MEPLIVFLELVLCAAVLFYVIQRLDKKYQNSQLLLREQQTKPLEDLDTAIAEWLLILKLPQLEEQTKREAAARQLSTLLIEKLMLRRCPARRPMNRHQPGLSGKAL